MTDFQKRIWKMTAEEMVARIEAILAELHSSAYSDCKRVTLPEFKYKAALTGLEQLGIDHSTSIYLMARRLEKRLIVGKPKAVAP